MLLRVVTPSTAPLAVVTVAEEAVEDPTAGVSIRHRLHMVMVNSNHITDLKLPLKHPIPLVRTLPNHHIRSRPIPSRHSSSGIPNTGSNTRLNKTSTLLPLQLKIIIPTTPHKCISSRLRTAARPHTLMPPRHRTARVISRLLRNLARRLSSGRATRSPHPATDHTVEAVGVDVAASTTAERPR